MTCSFETGHGQGDKNSIIFFKTDGQTDKCKFIIQKVKRPTPVKR